MSSREKWKWKRDVFHLTRFVYGTLVWYFNFLSSARKLLWAVKLKAFYQHVSNWRTIESMHNFQISIVEMASKKWKSLNAFTFSSMNKLSVFGGKCGTFHFFLSLSDLMGNFIFFMKSFLRSNIVRLKSHISLIALLRKFNYCTKRRNYQSPTLLIIFTAARF